MADIRKAYQTPDTFSNSAVTVTDPNPPYRWIPEMLDGHIHTAWRQLLTPLWTPAAIDRLKPKLRQRFTEVLDDVAACGSCEFVKDVALLFPNVIFMDLMGLPREEAEQFIRHGDPVTGSPSRSSRSARAASPASRTHTSARHSAGGSSPIAEASRSFLTSAPMPCDSSRFLA